MSDPWGERLGAALATLRTGDVDASGLVEGSRKRARAIRQRRVGAATAAVVLVIGIPVATASLRDEEPDPAAVLTSSPPPRTPNGPSASGGTASAGPSLGIPDLGGLGSGAGSARQTLLDSTRSLARQPVVFDQVCVTNWDTGARPQLGRTWSWTDRSIREHGATVGLVVTRWAPGTADERFTEVTTNTGYCRFLDRTVPHPAPAHDADQAWFATSVVHDVSRAYAVVRIGDLIAALTVQVPSDPGAALGYASNLAALLPLSLTGVGGDLPFSTP